MLVRVEGWVILVGVDGVDGCGDGRLPLLSVVVDMG